MIKQLGGTLYVWPREGRCCAHGLAWLEAGTAPRRGHEYAAVPAVGFELRLARMGRLPDELHLGVTGRRRRRVAAFWDGCCYVV